MTENRHPRIPSATYRLQFHAGFTFRDACAILDYLQDLGISDVYSSPYFQASPTSTHGYDVADHNRINPAIGDQSDFQAYTRELHRRDLGQVLDFVPNHMGIGESLNRWWMEVLEDGITSPYARYFDIDWHPAKEALADRVLLPILGERYGKVLENGEFKLSLDKGAFVLSYYETRLPISPRTYSLILRNAVPRLQGTALEKLREVIVTFGAISHSQDLVEAKSAAKKQLADLVASDAEISGAIDEALRFFAGEPGNPASFDPLHELLEAQSYRLSYWRVAAEEINYRRFFDINTLAAIRVEIPEVFSAAHQLVFDLLSRGDVTGLRIDHVDGLWNPREYFERLQSCYAELKGLPAGSQGLYLVVEKILDLTRERLAADWPVHGTTGYEFANQIVQYLTDSSSEKRLTKIYQRFTGFTDGFEDLIYEKKKLTIDISLGSEVAALGRMLDELSEMHRGFRDITRNTLTYAIGEVIACFPVYRTYATEEGVLSSDDEKNVLRAIRAARRRNPGIEKPVFDFIRSILLLRLPETLSPDQRAAHIRFVMKFQQCSGPVMAKGLEDTAFYLYNRLVALNEVGGNPGLYGLGDEDFHRLNAERVERSPHMLLATSTHDTKRSEDVRMRIVALSEMPDQWQIWLKQWHRLNKKLRTKIEGESAPSANEEYLLYQTLLGSWPLAPFADDEERKTYVGRINQYMLKALKEAKVNSSWTQPNEDWEKAVSDFVEGILDPAHPFVNELAQAAEKVAAPGAMNSLTQIILKSTLPGVPDFYQGTEVWDFSLVDPDNRRPVDYEARRQMLEQVRQSAPADLLRDWKTGGIKLFLIHRLLAFRREHASFFREAGYRALEVSGALARHVVAFARESGAGRLAVVTPRFTTALGAIPTPERWTDTSVSLEAGSWKNLLTGETLSVNTDKTAVSEIFAGLPFAVLHRLD